MSPMLMTRLGILAALLVLIYVVLVAWDESSTSLQQIAKVSERSARANEAFATNSSQILDELKKNNQALEELKALVRQPGAAPPESK